MDGFGFSHPYAFKVVDKDYATIEGFRMQHHNANPYGMSGAGPWSTQVALVQSRFSEVRNCYLYGGGEFPHPAQMVFGILLREAEGAVVEDYFFLLQTWAVWTASNARSARITSGRSSRTTRSSCS